MGMNETPSGERVHISFFGRRNAGKSSLLNAVTGQKLAVVSDVRGTTTDPVQKSMELLPLGPVVMIDTPGIDDEGELGALRVEKSYQVLDKTDIAVLVVDAAEGIGGPEQRLLGELDERKLPFVIAWNKSDGMAKRPDFEAPRLKACAEDGRLLFVSARTGDGIGELKECLAALYRKSEAGREEKRLVGDLISENDLIILVIPIDKAAPKGRLILPQQQMIRDILESGAQALCVRDTELAETLSRLERLEKKPRLVITDSQVFGKVGAIVPADIPLTSFSILFARYKGILELFVRGLAALKDIEDGDRILISEGCTHHRQCGDIGTVKLPRFIRTFTGKEPEFIFSSGTEFADGETLSSCRLIVHCGACMLNEAEMHSRMRRAEELSVPMTNYGLLIAYTQGILKRSVEIFPDIAALL
ncbi:MAG: [FeFe] hydrogenase H-cluster maturation GTPase HydF [Eubacteriales bacterium]|nr:[FeFe] hydrogenase H-cluster maturation GTPase HydF [Eubacteriales bacterium]